MSEVFLAISAVSELRGRTNALINLSDVSSIIPDEEIVLIKMKNGDFYQLEREVLPKLTKAISSSGGRIVSLS